MLLCGSVFLLALVHEVTAASDPYCGVEPYPSPIPELPGPAAGATLRQGFTFIRHGDRTTTTSRKCWNSPAPFAWDVCTSEQHDSPSLFRVSRREDYNQITTAPLNEETAYGGNCHVGQLTERGVWMSYNNGRRAGKYYRTLFNKAQVRFHPENLRSRSTNYYRTRQSGEAWLRGLFFAGQEGTDTWVRPTLSWVDADTDSLAFNAKLCPSLTKYLESYRTTDEWTTYYNNYYAPLLPLIANVTGMADANIQDLFDCMKAHKCQNRQLPQGLAELDDQITAAATNEYSMALQYNHTLASQLSTGPLMVEIYTRLTALKMHLGMKQSSPSSTATPELRAVMEDTEYGANAPFLRFYSGHDHGPILNFLTSFKLYDQLNMWPPYSSMINMDVFEIDGAMFLRIVYNGEVLDIPWCGSQHGPKYCSLDSFIDFVRPLMPLPKQCPALRPPAGYERFVDKVRAAALTARGRNDPAVESMYKFIADSVLMMPYMESVRATGLVQEEEQQEQKEQVVVGSSKHGCGNKAKAAASSIVADKMQQWKEFMESRT